MRVFASVLMIMLGLMPWSVARQVDGRLGLIQTPNNGMPAVTSPGGRFEAVFSGRAEAVRLVDESGGVRVVGEISWTELPGGRHAGHCVVPPDIGPGLYGLEAEQGGVTDRTVRAVCVRTAFPEYYVLAHVSDTHVLSGAEDDPSNVQWRAVLSAINASDASLVLVTGDLTHEGRTDQFQGFLSGLDTCVLPTFVCPGNHDRAGGQYAAFFGPLTYRFQFGLDGFLVFDTKDYFVSEGLGPADGDLYRFRRALKPCRWTFGVTHRYEPMMGMRSQLILFVDDPIDYLFFGHWHRENTDAEKGVPWGTTRYFVVPAAKDGYYRLVDVAVGGILPRSVQNAAAKE